MKTGKYITLGEHNDIKIGYGTVDFKNLKTIYLKFNSWVKPEDDTTDYVSIINKTRRRIKQNIYSFDNNLFKQESIVDLDIRTKGIKMDKKSFMNLEITLFVNEFFDIKSPKIKSLLKDLMVDIIDNDLSDKKLFNFYKTKK